MAPVSRRNILPVLLLVTALIAIIAVATVLVLDRRGEMTVAGTPSSAGGTPSAAAPSQAPLPKKLGPGARHVHMGDSYAAGTGESDLAPDAPVRCQRTSSNPGIQVAERMKWAVRDVSCTSAKTEHMTQSQHRGLAPQTEALDDSIDVVTVVLGANDEDFFGFLVSRCAGAGAEDPTGSPCRDQYGQELIEKLTSGTGPNLKAAYAEIAAKAPNAEIYAIGYPWLVPASGACRPELGFADGDIAFARELQAELNSRAKSAVESVGGTFVDMAELSDGHDACTTEKVRWIEPAFDADGRTMGIPGNHPNARGQRAMADALEKAIRAGR
ncbi:putative esterase [Gordonia hirsuta DSM 44140 = NBRC 16056]|uniref:Putative esterase n=1 Tax=Gordonia hirsuta DSM 44140 = NBRC 16056 TaxID=1121927 RepID=L7L9S4_9ACTN|nr:SGNH/GDSL hydrolase family protein [Gordonia hirsuta]GAC57674.1 putative esterase [Gordonia hirsuta DSM 44140 = NBRC 16056]